MTVAVVQPAMGVPPTENATIPLGATGEKLTPARVAVNVSDVFNGDGLAGAAVKLIVGFTFVIVYVWAAEAAVLKFESPE